MALLALVAVAGCGKVPLLDIGAQFTLADAAWFQEEETLFVFFRIDAMQGLGPDSQVEVTWRTDDDELRWTPLHALTPVHTHVPVDCGIGHACGSISLPVRTVPRQVGVRLRYHRDGALVLNAPVTLNVLGRGPPHTNRSLVVYGVFDEANERVQWRARHQFPTLRNEEVQALGLRRWFRVSETRYGDIGPQSKDNPYAYGFQQACDATLPLVGAAPLQTTERAIFDLTPLPRDAVTSPVVCGRAAVHDARGGFETDAIARKNPDAKPAFPSLRSPIRENTQIQFLLRPCERVISEPHLEMQNQRLLFSGAQEICVDDYLDAGFATDLARTFRARIDQVRTQGSDMVLVIGLHHDDATGKLRGVLELALEAVLPAELDKSSPRVSGAFVFDSMGYTVSSGANRRLVLWCPANIARDDLDQPQSTSESSCPLMPDMPDLVLGPFKFAQLPILPTRKAYLTFIDKYSVSAAGRSTKLTFRAPERTPFSDNVPVGDFGVVTFFNKEVLTAHPTDVFSHCAPADPMSAPIAFRTAASPDPMGLDALPQFHQTTPQPAYALGIFWDFPFLLRLEYRTYLAGAATAIGFTIPFGVGSDEESYYGAASWHTGEFPLAERLLKCTRFCDHPTFDSAGVYNATQRFNEAFLNQCYRPRFPVPTDGGFPRDP